VHSLHPVQQGDQGSLTVREAISTPHAPAAIGPYSQAIRAGDYLFLSGQIPLDPTTGAVVDGNVADQTRQVFRNLEAVLQAAGGSFDQVVKTTVYLTDMAEFGAMNDVYGSYFGAPAPARATVQAAALPRGVKVEIDLVAYLKQA
jgi:2-iminobutanoate/2-iminopropanoate deaminase